LVFFHPFKNTGHDNFYNINIENLANVKFSFSNSIYPKRTWYCLEYNVDEKSNYEIKQFFNHLINYAKTKEENEDNLKKRAINNIKHNMFQYQLLFWIDNPSFGNIIKLIWFGLLEVVVKNGYGGQVNFFISCICIVFVFSFIYFFNFQKKIPKSNNSFEINFGILVRYFSCIWFSFIVFANPRFPAKYFMFNSRFLYFVITEWVFWISNDYYFLYLYSK